MDLGKKEREKPRARLRKEVVQGREARALEESLFCLLQMEDPTYSWMGT